MFVFVTVVVMKVVRSFFTAGGINACFVLDRFHKLQHCSGDRALFRYPASSISGSSVFVIVVVKVS